MVPTFDDGERFYCRFDPAFVLPNSDSIDPLHIRLIPCPDFSSNRSKFSKPWHVLCPLAKFGNNVIFTFRIQDLPATVQGDGKGAAVHDVRTEHDPEEYNFSHCETRVYRAGARIGGHMKPGPKDKLRLIFGKILVRERSSDAIPPSQPSP